MKVMTDLGVEVLRLRDLDEIYEKGDEVTFDGYVVVSEPISSCRRPSMTTDTLEFKETKRSSEEEEDSRVFYPYQETGKLAFHTKDRFFAKTPEPLPEGLCGGPVLDESGAVCGIVEGIVDKKHPNKEIAGSAAFMPNYIMVRYHSR